MDVFLTTIKSSLSQIFIVQENYYTPLFLQPEQFHMCVKLDYGSMFHSLEFHAAQLFADCVLHFVDCCNTWRHDISFISVKQKIWIEHLIWIYISL